MDRSFSLQTLAFRGEEIESPRACGVSLLLLFRWSQAPSASIHSLVLNVGLEGGLHRILRVVFEDGASFSYSLWVSDRIWTVPFRCRRLLSAGRRSSLLVPAGSRFSSYSAGVKRLSLQCTLWFWIWDWRWGIASDLAGRFEDGASFSYSL